jgi:2,3-bisphosphoglycerate-dependent phosphoglycerate mutase
VQDAGNFPDLAAKQIRVILSGTPQGQTGILNEMPKLVLIRHGQSLWNLENRFTGWVDVPLTAQGEQEATNAGEKLKGMEFQVAYTSVLTRAQKTLELVMKAMGVQLPVIRDQALNERHYGDLQGLNKADTALKYGDDQVKIWRRSYDVPPPNGEALKNTAERTLPFFERCILGDIRQGKNVLVVAHGNSNRSIVMRLDNLSEKEVLELNLDTGVPLVYEMDEIGKVLGKSVLK